MKVNRLIAFEHTSNILKQDGLSGFCFVEFSAGDGNFMDDEKPYQEKIQPGLNKKRSANGCYVIHKSGGVWHEDN